jgi:hypothetical protein
MALTGNFIVNGLIVTNAYIRVERVVINPKKNVPNAEVMVRVYPDYTKSTAGAVSLHEAAGSKYNEFFADSAIAPEGRHNQERAYNYLKDLYPHLADSVDPIPEPEPESPEE